MATGIRRVKIAVIGAGTAGISACEEISKSTDDFVLINSGAYGTTCILKGCMPSKTLIYSSNIFHNRHKFLELAIENGEKLRLNIPQLLRRVRAKREYFLKNILSYIEELGDHNITGFARFISPNELRVDHQIIKADTIIIATGSSPRVPKTWREQFDELILNSTNIFEQQNLPAKIAVIGLSVLGTEMAQTLSRLGIEVHAFGAEETIGSLSDPEVSAYALHMLREEMMVTIGKEADVTRSGDRLLVTAGDEAITVDKIFIAMGRTPNIKGIGLEELGIISDDKTFPDVDLTTMRIKGFPIYIAGDANGIHPVLHEANNEGRIAGYNALHEPDKSFKRNVPLRIIFTDPEIAVIGKSYKELVPSLVAIGQTDFNNQGRAQITEENKGLLRIYADRYTGYLLGAEIFVPEGEHLAHLLAWLIEMNLTAEDAIRMPYYHPTMEEAIRSALRDLIHKIEAPYKPEETEQEMELS